MFLNLSDAESLPPKIISFFCEFSFDCFTFRTFLSDEVKGLPHPPFRIRLNLIACGVSVAGRFSSPQGYSNLVVGER